MRHPSPSPESVQMYVQMDGRSYADVTTKFSQLDGLPIFLPMVLRWRTSSAINESFSDTSPSKPEVFVGLSEKVVAISASPCALKVAVISALSRPLASCCVAGDPPHILLQSLWYSNRTHPCPLRFCIHSFSVLQPYQFKLISETLLSDCSPS